MERQFTFHQELDIPFDAAAHVLHDEPAVLLGLARDAAMRLANQHEIAPHVMTPMPTPGVEHDVEMVLGDPRRVDASTMKVPVTWTVVDGARWFPRVDGQLEVSSLNDDRPLCDISFFGSYTPRLGVVGAVLDLTATHRLVEDTLEAFFERACRELVETIDDEARDADPVVGAGADS